MERTRSERIEHKPASLRGLLAMVMVSAFAGLLTLSAVVFFGSIANGVVLLSEEGSFFSSFTVVSLCMVATLVGAGAVTAGGIWGGKQLGLWK